METWFVDKTLLIAAIVEVLLPPSIPTKLGQRDPLMITAPRKFGKTTNLEMLVCFFSGIVAREKFEKLKIGKNDPAMKWWGKLNTVYVTFGHFSGSIRSEEDCWKACRSIIHAAFQNFDKIADNLSEKNVGAFKEWISEKLYLNKTKEEVGNGLRFLIECVREYDKERNVILLVDEFDRICASACWLTKKEELEQVIKFYCDLVGEAVRHESQCVAVLSGVTSIHCKGLSASLNNINWRRFLEDKQFSKFYGVTEEEFFEVMERPKISARVSNLSAEALKWYNGYEAFGIKILNTFSFRKFIENAKIKSYWRESSSADSLDRSNFQSKELRSKIMDLINDQSISMNLKPLLKAIDFDSLKDKTKKLADTDVILNLLLQQGYMTIIGDRECNPVKIKAPNSEVKEEFNELLSEYYVEIYKFNPEKMRQCCNCFLRMDMQNEVSCQENLECFKKIVNELFSAVNLSEINEAWFESFIFQLFFQNFQIQEQTKVPGTSARNDKRYWKQLDMCILGEGRCFLFEFTVKYSAEHALKKILSKKYYNRVLQTKSPFLLIGIDVGEVEETVDVSINFLFNRTSGRGTKI